jgi:hypothetical protein
VPTRRAFLGAAASSAAAAAVALNPDRTAQAATAAPSPAPKPSASPGPTRPSKLARALAGSIQSELPKAHISDTMTDKIAADIQDNFAIGNAFRARANADLPPPDFVFSAVEDSRP